MTHHRRRREDAARKHLFESRDHLGIARRKVRLWPYFAAISIDGNRIRRQPSTGQPNPDAIVLDELGEDDV
jgi:hypothetical protein